MSKIYEIKNNKIFVNNTDDFDIEHILFCGQIFTYNIENNCYLISSNNNDYFINFFDLNTDYYLIKNNIKNKFKNKKLIYNIDEILLYGYGIRILKQSFVETVIGFVISANNNIKRIIKSMQYIREKLGEKLTFENIEYYSFPTLEILSEQDEQFFINAGCGYRAKSIVKLISQLQNINYFELEKLTTEELKNKLIELSGVGEKVADCILLFCFARKDVFPVDTWIKKIYSIMFEKEDNTSVIRKKLILEFGDMSGYVQQYLFFFIRGLKEKVN